MCCGFSDSWRLTLAKGTLATLVKLRRLAVEEAQRGLARALAAEEDVAKEETALAEAIEHEIAAAAHADPLIIGASLHGWLAQAKRRQAEAGNRRAEAQAATETARQAIAEARTAEKQIQTLVDRRAAEARAEAEKRAQADLLEIILLSGIGRAGNDFGAGVRDRDILNIADDGQGGRL
jgi:flagellar biosynthesis chaperone FliJ